MLKILISIYLLLAISLIIITIGFFMYLIAKVRNFINLDFLNKKHIDDIFKNGEVTICKVTTIEKE